MLGRPGARRIVLASGRFIVAGIFLYSAIPKIVHPYIFLASIYKYELVGPRMGLMAAVTIPWLELVIAFCALSNLWCSGAMFVVAMLMVGYSIAGLSVILRGLTIGCAFFGNGDDTSHLVNYATITRSFLIGCIAVVCYTILIFRPPSRLTDD